MRCWSNRMSCDQGVWECCMQDVSWQSVHGVWADGRRLLQRWADYQWHDGSDEASAAGELCSVLVKGLWSNVAYSSSWGNPTRELWDVSCRKGSHSVICHPCLYPSQASWYSIYNPGGMEGWVDLGGWLHTEMVTRQQMVTHPTKRARHRAAMLIETNAVPLSHATTYLVS